MLQVKRCSARRYGHFAFALPGAVPALEALAYTATALAVALGITSLMSEKDEDQNTQPSPANESGANANPSATPNTGHSGIDGVLGELGTETNGKRDDRDMITNATPEALHDALGELEGAKTIDRGNGVISTVVGNKSVSRYPERKSKPGHPPGYQVQNLHGKNKTTKGNKGSLTGKSSTNAPHGPGKAAVESNNSSLSGRGTISDTQGLSDVGKDDNQAESTASNSDNSDDGDAND